MKEDKRELAAAIRALEEVANEEDGYDAGSLEPNDIAIVLEELDSLRCAVASQGHASTDAHVFTAFAMLLIQTDPSGCTSSSEQVDLCFERARRVAGRFKEALENEAYRTQRALRERAGKAAEACSAVLKKRVGT